MITEIHTIKVAAHKKRKLLGRGNASGHGSYSGKGQKGQRARSGGKGGLKLKGFKQNLLNLPKYKGMKSLNPANQLVATSMLEKVIADGDQITVAYLLEKKLIESGETRVKILFDKPITKKISLSGCRISAKAQAAIESVGGQVLTMEKKVRTKNK
jgi:large subunit ribosomal protein L15